MADAPASTAEWTCAALAQRLVRYADLIPCFNAFVDWLKTEANIEDSEAVSE